MTFDSGTWWLFGMIATALLGMVTYLIKRSLFERVDKCEKSLEAIKEKYTLKSEHDKNIDECKKDITRIRESYATKTDLKELREEIKEDLQQTKKDITEALLRAQSSNEHNFQRIYDLMIKNGGKKDG